MENERIKTCADCVHFVQHYAVWKMRLRKVGGHCTSKRNKKADLLCQHFVLRDREQEKQQDCEAIVEYMAEIAHRMNDIKEILRNQN